MKQRPAKKIQAMGGVDEGGVSQTAIKIAVPSITRRYLVDIHIRRATLYSYQVSGCMAAVIIMFSANAGIGTIYRS